MRKKVMSVMLMVLVTMIVFSQQSCSGSKKRPKILVEKMEEIKSLHKKIHTDVSKSDKKHSSNEKVKNSLSEADKLFVYAKEIFNDDELKMSDGERLDRLDKINKDLKEIDSRITQKKKELSIWELRKKMMEDEVRKSREIREREKQRRLRNKNKTY